MITFALHPSNTFKVQTLETELRTAHSEAWPFLSRDLAKKGEGRVFATDALLTTLMCAPRSVYSWDIIVERRGDFLFFDKRDGAALDQLTGNISSEGLDSPHKA